jgi:hypothetical protein
MQQDHGIQSRWIVFGLIFMAFIWVHNEQQWQRKLDNALSDCLTPMSDGSCGGRYHP